MDEWQGKRVIIIGAGRQGAALARYLARHGAQVVITDRQPAEALRQAMTSLQDVPVEWKVGGHPLGLLDGADIVCPSGGVPLDIPLLVEARRRGIPFSNDSQIFLQRAPCPVVGITGSAGKTTTTTLVGRMAQMASRQGSESFLRRAWVDGAPEPLPWPTTNHLPRRAWVGGNIGNPLIQVVDEMQPDDLAVVELSSFQLEIMTSSPQVAAVLNITPNHLDRHGDMATYTAAKANILRYQGPDEVAVLGREDPVAWGLKNQVRGRLVSFGRGEPPSGSWCTFLRQGQIVLRREGREEAVLPVAEVQLRGEHNLLNVLAACAIASAAGLPVQAMRAGVRGFQGVPHRLEFVRRWRGADWYNDSIATAPERAVAALKAFDAPLVLLAGGRDKNLPWDDLIALICQRVDHLITFGEIAEMIAQKVNECPSPRRPETVTCCPGLQSALETAADLVEPGDVVLLSPGGTSFDEFHDFAERGERFKDWLRQQK